MIDPQSRALIRYALETLENATVSDDSDVLIAQPELTAEIAERLRIRLSVD